MIKVVGVSNHNNIVNRIDILLATRESVCFFLNIDIIQYACLVEGAKQDHNVCSIRVLYCFECVLATNRIRETG